MTENHNTRADKQPQNHAKTSTLSKTVRLKEAHNNRRDASYEEAQMLEYLQYTVTL